MRHTSRRRRADHGGARRYAGPVEGKPKTSASTHDYQGDLPSAVCPSCGARVRLRADGTLWNHKVGGGRAEGPWERCEDLAVVEDDAGAGRVFSAQQALERRLVTRQMIADRMGVPVATVNSETQRPSFPASVGKLDRLGWPTLFEADEVWAWLVRYRPEWVARSSRKNV